MPNRIIREGLNDSSRMLELFKRAGWGGTEFFRRLLNLVDDYGCHELRETVLRNRLYSCHAEAEIDAAKIKEWINAAVAAGAIIVYENRGKKYFWIPNFGQQIRTAPKFPLPPDQTILKYETCPARAQQMISKRRADDVQSQSVAHLGAAVGVGAVKDVNNNTINSNSNPDSAEAAGGLRRDVVVAVEKMGLKEKMPELVHKYGAELVGETILYAENQKRAESKSGLVISLLAKGFVPPEMLARNRRQEQQIAATARAAKEKRIQDQRVAEEQRRYEGRWAEIDKSLAGVPAAEILEKAMPRLQDFTKNMVRRKQKENNFNIGRLCRECNMWEQAVREAAAEAMKAA